MLAMRRSAAARAPFPLSPADPGIRPTKPRDTELQLTMKSTRTATCTVSPNDAVAVTPLCLGRLAVFGSRWGAA